MKPVRSLKPLPTNTWVARLAARVARRLPLVTLGRFERMEFSLQMQLADQARQMWEHDREMRRMMESLVELPFLLPEITATSGPGAMERERYTEIRLAFETSYTRFTVRRDEPRRTSSWARATLRACAQHLAQNFAENQLAPAIERIARAKLNLVEPS